MPAPPLVPERILEYVYPRDYTTRKQGFERRMSCYTSGRVVPAGMLPLPWEVTSERPRDQTHRHDRLPAVFQ
jgi:hypothetical protein